MRKIRVLCWMWAWLIGGCLGGNPPDLPGDGEPGDATDAGLSPAGQDGQADNEALDVNPADTEVPLDADQAADNGDGSEDAGAEHPDGGFSPPPADGGADAGEGDAGDANQPPPMACPTTVLVATFVSEVAADGDVDCRTAADPSSAAEGTWDLGLTGEFGQGDTFASCDDDQPTCRFGARRVILSMTRLPDDGVRYNNGCLLAGQSSGIRAVATIYSRIDANGARTCLTAAAPQAAEAGYWDLDEYGHCSPDGRPECRLGSRLVPMATALQPDGSVKTHNLCILHNQPGDANIVANIYSNVKPDEEPVCLAAGRMTARAAGYFDLGEFGTCDDQGRPQCVLPSRKVVSAMTGLPDGRMKYHTICLLNDQPTSTAPLATIFSQVNADGDSLCLTADAPEAAAVGYWDLANAGACDDANQPTCRNNTEKVVLAMTDLPDGTVKYHTACIQRPDRLVLDGHIRPVYDLDFWGWYYHDWTPASNDHDRISRVTNVGVARTAAQVVALREYDYQHITFGFVVWPLMEQIPQPADDEPAFRAQFEPLYRTALDELRSELLAADVLDDIDVFYIADEPALHRDLFRSQAFLDWYADVFAAEFPGKRLAMAFAQDPSGDGMVRGLHYDPPPAVDILFMDPYFWHNEHPCDAAYVRDYLYRDNPNAALDWALKFDKQVVLIGDAMLKEGVPTRECLLDLTYELARDDPRLSGLIWFIYNPTFADGPLTGAAHDPAFVEHIEGLYQPACR